MVAPFAKNAHTCQKKRGGSGGQGPPAAWKAYAGVQNHHKVILKPKTIKNHNFSFLQVRIASLGLRNSIPIIPEVVIWPKSWFWRSIFDTLFSWGMTWGGAMGGVPPTKNPPWFKPRRRPETSLRDVSQRRLWETSLRDVSLRDVSERRLWETSPGDVSERRLWETSERRLWETSLRDVSERRLWETSLRDVSERRLWETSPGYVSERRLRKISLGDVSISMIGGILIIRSDGPKSIKNLISGAIFLKKNFDRPPPAAGHFLIKFF